jgi:hypothetical protein
MAVDGVDEKIAAKKLLKISGSLIFTKKIVAP